MKILHIITSLRHGGAQLWMRRLIRELPHEAEIITLLSPAPMADDFTRLGVPVRVVNLRSPQALVRLGRLVRSSKADLVQTWMHHADLFGGVMARLVTKAPVVWNVRATKMDAAGIPRATRAVVRACSLLSGKVPSRIICASESSRDWHATAGYDRGRMVVIPNGCDSQLFRPDDHARLTLRQELGIPDNAILVGLVARASPLKDHQNFLTAADLVAQHFPEVHFLLCGDGTEHFSAGSPAVRLHRLGRRDDIHRVTAALDISCLASYTEAFPNVVAEAMSCEVAPVATDVGDSRSIIRDAGIVVPPRDSVALAEGIMSLIERGKEGRRELGRRGRARIERDYSIQTAVSCYINVYDEVLDGHASSPRN
jgi:glycosyltransferase involved in cell wall biosynthesis